MKYIKNARIVLPDRIESDTVLAYSNKIEGFVDKIPECAEVIDANGGYVCPGLVDIHIHGYMGDDASDGDADGIKRMANELAKNGVTSFLPTTMTLSYEELERAFDAIRSQKEDSKNWSGAEILGVNAEGPFINPSKKGAQNGEYIKTPDADFVLANADIIRAVTIAPETDKEHTAIKKIKENSDILISMGHTGASYEEAMEAVRDGVSHATHLFNAMTPLAHRDPGVVGAALASDVSVELICDTFHIHPGVFSIIAALKPDKLCLITDCIRAGGMPDGNYDLGGLPVKLSGIECRLEDGTIAGSVLKLNEAIRNLLANTSLSVPEAVAAATFNPARAIGETHKGALITGYDADIIITDEDFNIKKTIKKGKTIYEA